MKVGKYGLNQKKIFVNKAAQVYRFTSKEVEKVKIYSFNLYLHSFLQIHVLTDYVGKMVEI